MKILREKQEDIVSGRWKVAEDSVEENEILDTIMEEEEEENGQEDFMCFFCGRSFKTKQGCTTHQRNCAESH